MCIATSLTDNRILDPGAVAIAQMLARNRTLRVLRYVSAGFRVGGLQVHKVDACTGSVYIELFGNE